MRFAVVACSACEAPWLLETRHKKSACPKCHKSIDVLRRKRYWQGDDPVEARGAIAHLRAVMAGANPTELTPPPKLAKHDHPLDAVAAKARNERNASKRAEEVAYWMQELIGPASHETYLDALQRAGLPPQRAEAEINRLLARDYIYEPRAGCYAALA